MHHYNFSHNNDHIYWLINSCRTRAVEAETFLPGSDITHLETNIQMSVHIKDTTLEHNVMFLDLMV